MRHSKDSTPKYLAFYNLFQERALKNAKNDTFSALQTKDMLSPEIALIGFVKCTLCLYLLHCGQQAPAGVYSVWFWLQLAGAQGLKSMVSKPVIVHFLTTQGDSCFT